MPVCGRCQDTETQCQWKRSQRGYRRTRNAVSQPGKHSETSQTASSINLDNASGQEVDDLAASDYDASTALQEFDFNDWDPLSVFALPRTMNDDDMFDAAPSALTNLPDPCTIYPFPQAENIGLSERYEPTEVQLAQQGRSNIVTKTPGQWQQFLHTYYIFFHPAHPILPPLSLLSSGQIIIPEYLRAIMAFAACHYIPGHPRESLYDKASAALLDALTEEDGFKVQALFIWALTLWSRCDISSAILAFHRAVDLIIKLEMDRAEFSRIHGREIPQLEESWRRTWWDLYTADAVLAMLASGGYRARLIDRKSDVPLPCEEDVYQNNKPIPPPRTFREFQTRQFAEEEYEYSSFAYRIEAARLWGSIILTTEKDKATCEEQVSVLDISLAHYFVSLPPSKRTIEEHSGKVDEVLFSAHMLINCALISLHKTFSDLALVENNHPTVCTQTTLAPAPILLQPEHTSKAIRAANALMQQTALPTALFFHCPCFTCAIAMAASVYIPAYALEKRKDRLHVLHERLQLAIGALRTIGEVWPMAKAARAQVAAFARDTLYEKEHAAGGSILSDDGEEGVVAGVGWLQSVQDLSRA